MGLHLQRQRLGAHRQRAAHRRADVTTYTYYPNNDADLGKRGNVATITNALGHTTSITAYNAHGQPLTIVDPNGLTTAIVYDARLRLTSRTRRFGDHLVHLRQRGTTHQGDAARRLVLEYDYDDAHRLTSISDNLGNRIAYTLDAMGNRTQEQVFDPANALAQTRNREFNSLNRLFQELGAQGQTTEYAYDNQGNVTRVKDPLNKVTANQYDALNRLRQVTDPGARRHAVRLQRPRRAGLGERSAQPRDRLHSRRPRQPHPAGRPDTGTTTNTYDAAGNLLTQTDAKGQTTTYAYDALNRVTLITFHDGSKQAYAYERGTNSIGRLDLDHRDAIRPTSRPTRPLRLRPARPRRPSIPSTPA